MSSNAESRFAQFPLWLLALLVAGSVCLAALRSQRSLAYRVAEQQRRQESPRVTQQDGYIGSDRCVACHPGEHASWHDTYHRTMTQVATPEAVLGDFNNVTLKHFGKTYLLQRIGDQFWISQSGGAGRRVLQTTGSHHYQVYWVDGGPGNMLQHFPFVYLLDEQRWVRRNHVFMMPPKLAAQPESVMPWNEGCVRCHATHGKSRVHTKSKFAKTEVAELGIACEACHGPGAAHASHFENPLRRYQQHADQTPPQDIVNPAACDSKRSAEVCGQCHSVNAELDRERWRQEGTVFRPGDRLADTRQLARHPNRNTTANQKSRPVPNAAFYQHYFWPDGMMRVAGREYNGLVETPCFQRGDMSCLSCHQLHDSPPDDQLAASMRTNAACVQCHQQIGDDLAAHTHHAADSAGSNCYNCHMPHTTYGLLKLIRSHQIDSPSVATTLNSGRTNACNLCHIDRTLEWTADHLTEWYGQPRPELTETQRTVSAVVADVLAGDAAQRAMAAWHLGWRPAQQASGSDWVAPFLAQCLNDDYAPVRYIAAKTLRSLAEYEDFEYDFSQPDAEASQRALGRWQAGRSTDSSTTEATARSPVLQNQQGLDQSRFEALLRQRDTRPVDLFE